jgi:short-subunit dehydrogenase
MATYWQNKTCLVTGASAGLGRAIAAALAARGATVVLVARRKEPLDEAADSLTHQFSSEGASAIALPGDVAWQEDVERIATTVREQFGRLDMLCNCAGRSTRAAALDTTPEDFQQLLDLNFLAPVRMTRALADLLQQSRGHLVNVGSLASKVAPRYMGAYPASKFALAAYTQQLRLELGPAGVHVMLVCPGPIRRDLQTGEGRYADQASNVPAAAQAPGGGARVKALDPQWLATKILWACERRQPELVVPGKARFLFALSQLSASWGDWLLSRSME